MAWILPPLTTVFTTYPLLTVIVAPMVWSILRVAFAVLKLLMR